MSIFTSLSQLFHKVIDWIKGAEEKLHPVIVIAENVLNALKSFNDSTIGKTVIAIVEAEIPASTGLINAFQLQLPIWLVELKWIDGESTKTLEEQWQDAQAYLKTVSPDVYASQYNTLKALFIKFFADNGGAVVTIQQSLVLAQPTHSMDYIA